MSLRPQARRGDAKEHVHAVIAAAIEANATFKLSAASVPAAPASVGAPGPAVVTFTGTNSKESFPPGSAAAVKKEHKREVKDLLRTMRREFLTNVEEWHTTQKNAEESLKEKIITPEFKSECVKQLIAAQEDPISDENMQKFKEERLFLTLANKLGESSKAFSLYWNEAKRVLEPNNLKTKFLAGLKTIVDMVREGLLDVDEMLNKGDYEAAAQQAANIERLLTNDDMLDEVQREVKIVKISKVSPDLIVDDPLPPPPLM